MTSWINIICAVYTTGVLLLRDVTAVPELRATCKIPSTREFCYSLHGTDNRDPDARLLAWDDASQLCANASKDLAVVDSPDVQEIVAELVQSIDSDQNKVWIAGRRRYQQSDWAFLNDTAFEGSVTEYYSSSCVKLYFDKHGLFEYREIRCTDDWNVYALCQYNSTEQECQGFYRSGLCYVTSENNMNWFDGMTYCYNRSDGTGSLAYDGLDKNETQQWLASVRNDQYSKELLVGIRRQPWVWVLGSRDLPMVYYHWLPIAGDYTGDRCVTVVPDQDQRWSDVPCSEEWYYFVCQNGSRPETTTTTTTTTTSSILGVPSNSATLPSNIGQSFTTARPGSINTGTSDVNPGQQQPVGTSQSSPSTDPYDRKLKTEHIVAIVVGILVVAVIILSVIAIHRCPRKTEDPETAYVSELKLVSGVQATEPEVVFKDSHKQQNGLVTHTEEEKHKDVVKEENPTAASDAKQNEGHQREDGRSNSSNEGQATGGNSEEERSSSSADSRSTAATEDARPTGARLAADGEGESQEDGVEDKPKDSVDVQAAESAKDNTGDDDMNRNELDESLEDTAIWVAL